MKNFFCLFLFLTLASFAVSCRSTSEEAPPPVSGGGVNVVGNNWLIKFPSPTEDGNSPKNIEFRLVKDTAHPTIAEDADANATSIKLSSVEGFPPSGKIYAFNGETIGYASISGNTLQGLTRGMDASLPQNQAKEQSVYLVTLERKIGDKKEYQMPQMPDDYFVHYRVQNDSQGNGDDWGGFMMVGFAQGSGTSTESK